MKEKDSTYGVLIVPQYDSEDDEVRVSLRLKGDNGWQIGSVSWRDLPDGESPKPSEVISMFPTDALSVAQAFAASVKGIRKNSHLSHMMDEYRDHFSSAFVNYGGGHE